MVTQLEVENKRPLSNPSAVQISRELEKLRSYGRHTFASLSCEDGSYVQVAGGGVGCMLEKRERDGRHYRASQAVPVVPPEFADGTILVFGGGRVALKRDEWFRINQVIEVFTAFSKKEPLPEYIQWRDVSDMFR